MDVGFGDTSLLIEVYQTTHMLCVMKPAWNTGDNQISSSLSLSGSLKNISDID